jgi:hypothetical protein
MSDSTSQRIAELEKKLAEVTEDRDSWRQVALDEGRKYATLLETVAESQGSSGVSSFLADLEGIEHSLYVTTSQLRRLVGRVRLHETADCKKKDTVEATGGETQSERGEKATGVGERELQGGQQRRELPCSSEDEEEESVHFETR